MAKKDTKIKSAKIPKEKDNVCLPPTWGEVNIVGEGEIVRSTADIKCVKHPGGRPRTVSPPPDECIRLGKEMVEWVDKHKPSHLSEWFSIEKMITWKQWDAMCQREEFVPYYEIALNMVARNIREGIIDKSLGQRFLNLYHRDLKKDEMDMVKYQADVKAKADEMMQMNLAELNKKLKSGEISQK